MCSARTFKQLDVNFIIQGTSDIGATLGHYIRVHVATILSSDLGGMGGGGGGEYRKLMSMNDIIDGVCQVRISVLII